MDAVRITLILVCMAGIVEMTPNSVATFCEDEAFTAECGPGQVVLMREARYGRMRLGRCLDANFGYIGCATDVLAKFDTLCSGRQSCQVEVRDLVEVKPCPKDLRGYLEAAYTCTNILLPGADRCGPSNLPTVTAPSGVLASLTTQRTGCGGIDAPWLIQAAPGRRVNLTLFDFSAAAAAAASGGVGGLRRDQQPPGMYGQAQVCQVLAVIKESGAGASETVCGGQKREHHVYTSSTSSVEVRAVFQRNSADNNRHFLLRFKVWGCADLAVSAATRFDRRGSDEAVVSCRSGEKWAVRCEGDAWAGEWHNCTDLPVAGESVGTTMLPLPYGVSVVIMVAIAVIIGILVLVFGLVYIRRRKAGAGGRPPVLPAQPGADKEYYVGPPDYADPYNLPAPPGAENAYYKTWQLQRNPRAAGHMLPPPPASSHMTGHMTGQMTGHMTSAHGPPGPPAPPSYESTSDNGYSGYTEHIYESPKSVRKEYEARYGIDAPGGMQYFELDHCGASDPIPPRKN